MIKPVESANSYCMEDGHMVMNELYLRVSICFCLPPLRVNRDPGEVFFRGYFGCG